MLNIVRQIRSQEMLGRLSLFLKIYKERDRGMRIFYGFYRFSKIEGIVICIFIGFNVLLLELDRSQFFC